LHVLLLTPLLMSNVGGLGGSGGVLVMVVMTLTDICNTVLNVCQDGVNTVNDVVAPGMMPPMARPPGPPPVFARRPSGPPPFVGML